VARNRFVMIDPERAELLNLSAGTWKVLWSMAGVDITQEAIADKHGMPLRTVNRHVACLKKQGIVVRQKNKQGRVKFRINPEYIWDYKLAIRNELVADIRHARMKKTA